jgi:hypothetical protein
MIILTGDTHGDFRRVGAICDKIQPTKDDVLVILGDTGINSKPPTANHAPYTPSIVGVYFLHSGLWHIQPVTTASVNSNLPPAYHPYLDCLTSKSLSLTLRETR